MEEWISPFPAKAGMAKAFRPRPPMAVSLSTFPSITLRISRPARRTAGIEVNFPLTVKGDIKHHLATDIGGGGPTIRAETTNGGVTLSHGSGSGSDSSGHGES